MINELSVLIPCHNSKCTKLVESLIPLLEKECNNGSDSFKYEIIVADDGSTDTAYIEHNKSINTLPNSRYIARGFNAGRAAIRNFLASEAQYEWLLFMDCDRLPSNDNFIRTYREKSGKDVTCGGYTIKNNNRNNDRNLRYRYEQAHISDMKAYHRSKHPHSHFCTTNFIAAKHIMERYKFDERFRKYGYEDVFFGKTLCDNNVEIRHIDNPTCLEEFDSNTDFIAKTEEGMHTLCEFQNELNDYSSIIKFHHRIKKCGALPLVKAFHYLFGKAIKHNLTGNNPRLFLFNIYKIGYFSSIKN